MKASNEYIQDLVNQLITKLPTQLQVHLEDVQVTWVDGSYVKDNPLIDNSTKNAYAFVYSLTKQIFVRVECLQDEDFLIKEILAHELAHIVTRAVYGNVPSHGKEFRRIAKFMGCSGRASVPSDIVLDNSMFKTRRKRFFTYVNDKGITHNFTKKYHNSLLRGAVLTVNDNHRFSLKHGSKFIKQLLV